MLGVTSISTTKGKKEAQKQETKQKKLYSIAFNAVAQLEKELTDLHKANPKFEFDIEKDDKGGAYIVTNIPLVNAEKKEMEISVTGNNIHLTVDRYNQFLGGYSRYYAASRVKKAVKIVARNIGAKGLASKKQSPS